MVFALLLCRSFAQALSDALRLFQASACVSAEGALVVGRQATNSCKKLSAMQLGDERAYFWAKTQATLLAVTHECGCTI